MNILQKVLIEAHSNLNVVIAIIYGYNSSPSRDQKVTSNNGLSGGRSVTLTEIRKYKVTVKNGYA